MDARDELALELFIADNHAQPREQSVVDWEWFEKTERFRGRIEYYKTMASAALTAGYRKPRTIETAAGLDALPVGSVVKGDRFGVAIKEDDESPVPWASDGARCAESSADVLSYLGTAVLLFEPEVTA